LGYIEKRKGKKRKSTKGSLVQITPLVSSNSGLAKVFGGVEIITKGAFATAPIFANIMIMIKYNEFIL
jgi:hypothetical protein